MNAGARILLSLDAHECWAGGATPTRRAPPARRPPLARVETPVLPARGAIFGTVGGAQSIAEVQDLLRIYNSAMQQLSQSYANASPGWVAKDSAGFIDWTNDWSKLQARYAAAASSAQTAITLSAAVPLPATAIPAQASYDGIMKAIRQCYPPDGCPAVKGDWDDLVMRLTAATQKYGLPAPVLTMLQPSAGTDIDQQVFATTAPVDVVAQLTGAQKAGPLSPNALSWIVAHKTALIAGGIAIVGGLVLIELFPLLGLVGKGAKAVAAIAA